jgi:hypothetical protein
MGALKYRGEQPQLFERPPMVGLGPGAAQPALDLRPVALGQVVEHIASL